MTCPHRFITNLLLALGCSYPLPAQDQASGLRSAAVVRASLQGSTAIQSKQSPAKPEVDIRIAHPEYNAIGRVDALLPAGISHGTGVLINECLVLTNRHVVGGLNKVVKFRVGFTGDFTKPFAHEVSGVVVGIGAAGMENYDQGQDWAILKLNSPIGRKPLDGGVGSIPAMFASEGKVRNCPSPEIAGFPGNNNHETYIHHQNCKFDGYVAGIFGFRCSAEAGESGSPVLCRFPDGSFKIIALVRSSEGQGTMVGAVDFNFDRETISKVVLQYKDACH